MSEQFLNWSKDKESWFGCINFMDAHFPYEPKSKKYHNNKVLKMQESIDNMWDFVENDQELWRWKVLENLYDDTIIDIDKKVGKIIKELKERGEYEDTLIVLTSDHGEGFGEYNNFLGGFRSIGHNIGSTESLLHVPLVVKEPKQNEQYTEEKLVSTKDIFEIIKSVHNDDDYNITNKKIISELLEQDPKLLNSISDNLSKNKYKTNFRVLYEENGNFIEKTTVYGYESRKVKICKNIVENNNKDHFENVKEFVEDKNRQLNMSESSDENDIDEDLEGQLEDLGYI